MNRAILVYITFVLGLVFLATPRGETFQPYLFSDRISHKEDYWYYLWEHACKIVLFKVIWDDSKEYQNFFKAMFWFQIIDTADYLLTYNEVWFHVIALPISANTVGFTALAGILLNDYLWRLWR